MAKLTPAKFASNTQRDLKKVEDNISAFNDSLNPLAGTNTGQTPFYNTAARALIRIGGKPAAICTSLSYNLSYNVEEIRCLDTNVSYDVDIGAATIKAQLNTIIDPTAGPEFYSLFSTLSSSVHQPLVEMQVLDAGTGTSVFFARGVFNTISANISRGGVSSYSAGFTGIYMQNYVDQSFRPYTTVGAISGVLSSAISGLSGLTGGIL